MASRSNGIVIRWIILIARMIKQVFESCEADAKTTSLLIYADAKSRVIKLEEFNGSCPIDFGVEKGLQLV